MKNNIVLFNSDDMYTPSNCNENIYKGERDYCMKLFKMNLINKRLDYETMLHESE